jgi:putative alpha-1,2-mannosidase
VNDIGTPILKEAIIQTPSGKTFTVTAKNVSETNKYIQSATLNGKKYTRTYVHQYITQSDINAGGVLEFTLGPKPNKNWGNKTD